jgi:hypothetical protein
MSQPHHRLRLAREARYHSAAEAAKALGVPYPTYAAHEGGFRGFSAQAARYARFLKVRLDWLLEGQGPMRPGVKPPVLELYESLPRERQVEALRYLEYLKNQP